MELSSNKPIDYSTLTHVELVDAVKKRDALLESANAHIDELRDRMQLMDQSIGQYKQDNTTQHNKIIDLVDKIDGLKQAMRRQLEATSELLESC